MIVEFNEHFSLLSYLESEHLIKLTSPSSLKYTTFQASMTNLFLILLLSLATCTVLFSAVFSHLYQVSVMRFLLHANRQANLRI